MADINSLSFGCGETLLAGQLNIMADAIRSLITLIGTIDDQVGSYIPLSGSENISGVLAPNTNEGHNLGKSNKRWGTVWASVGGFKVIDFYDLQSPYGKLGRLEINQDGKLQYDGEPLALLSDINNEINSDNQSFIHFGQNVRGRLDENYVRIPTSLKLDDVDDDEEEAISNNYYNLYCGGINIKGTKFVQRGNYRFEEDDGEEHHTLCVRDGELLFDGNPIGSNPQLGNVLEGINELDLPESSKYLYYNYNNLSFEWADGTGDEVSYDSTDDRGKYLKVKNDGTGTEWVSASPGGSNILGLSESITTDSSGTTHEIYIDTNEGPLSETVSIFIPAGGTTSTDVNAVHYNSSGNVVLPGSDSHSQPGDLTTGDILLLKSNTPVGSIIGDDNNMLTIDNPRGGGVKIKGIGNTDYVQIGGASESTATTDRIVLVNSNRRTTLKNSTNLNTPGLYIVTELYVNSQWTQDGAGTAKVFVNGQEIGSGSVTNLPPTTDRSAGDYLVLKDDNGTLKAGWTNVTSNITDVIDNGMVDSVAGGTYYRNYKLKTSGGTATGTGININTLPPSVDSQDNILTFKNGFVLNGTNGASIIFPNILSTNKISLVNTAASGSTGSGKIAYLEYNGNNINIDTYTSISAQNHETAGTAKLYLNGTEIGTGGSGLTGIGYKNSNDSTATSVATSGLSLTLKAGNNVSFTNSGTELTINASVTNSGGISDVTVAGTSVVSNGTAVIPKAGSTYGVIKAVSRSGNATCETANSSSTTLNYKVLIDNSGVAFVNVPWTASGLNSNSWANYLNGQTKSSTNAGYLYYDGSDITTSNGGSSSETFFFLFISLLKNRYNSKMIITQTQNSSHTAVTSIGLITEPTFIEEDVLYMLKGYFQSGGLYFINPLFRFNKNGSDYYLLVVVDNVSSPELVYCCVDGFNDDDAVYGYGTDSRTITNSKEVVYNISRYMINLLQTKYNITVSNSNGGYTASSDYMYSYSSTIQTVTTSNVKYYIEPNAASGQYNTIDVSI